MILNLGSLAFNANTTAGGGTPAWGTELGQGEGYRFSFEDMSDFFTGMVYCSVPDLGNVTCPLGKGGNQQNDYDFVIASLFDKVYVNDKRVKDARFLLLIVKKLVGDYHVGRRTIKYNPRMTYNDEFINEDCYKKMTATLGWNKDAAWFVHEMLIRNQDELHFYAYQLGDQPMYYASNDEKKNAFLSKLPKDGKRLYRDKSTDFIQKIYYGTPGSGKSHKVKNVVEGLYSDEQEREKYVFRTTFHPDSDYASFVGCYKPTKDKESSQGKSEMSVDDLAVSLKQYYNDDNFGKIGGLQRFCYDYERYLNKLDSGEFSKILEKAGLSSNYEIEIKKYLGFQKLISNKKTGGITYEFVPQAFTNAYVKAWLEPDKQVYLIIEEINRGNCAQIFGDLFQLLDRKDGVSEYPINADADLRQYLEKDEVLGEDSEGIANGKLKLPANLNILATMNTSDQSLFPMDSAFKRRWTWECVPIDYENADSSKFMIKINGKVYNWHKFLKNVNERIKSVTHSEDKQMGNFFISSNIDERQFIDKVMFYLWNDICKEEYKTTNNFFRNYTNDAKTDKVEFTFNDLFDKTQNGDNKLLVGFMDYIGVEAE